MKNNQNNISSLIVNKTYIHILLIILVSFCAYSNTFSVPFHFDDFTVIVENPSLGDLNIYTDPSTLKKYVLWRSVNDFFYTRYIGFFSFSLNYLIDHLDVFGYHLVNYAIHVINGMLVYFLILITLKIPSPNAPVELSSRSLHGLTALLISLIFVAHPVNTQAVTYIVQRFTCLATMFYLMSLFLYIRFRLSDAAPARALLYFLSIASAIFAMLTKEISFTLPIIICLYEFIFLKANLKKRLLYLFPFLLSFALIPFQLLVTKSLFGTANNISATLQLANEYNLTWSEYLFTQFRVIITYIRLMLFPANQNLDYDYPTFHTFFTPPVLFSFICLLSISCIALFLLHRSSLIKKHSTHLRLIAFGIFWFFITLSVESSIIPIDDVIFEHRLYLPSVGLIVSIIMGLLLLTDKFSITKPNSAKIIIAAMIIIVVPFSAASYSRNAIWHSEISLWEDVVLKSPQKARPHSNLGQAYLADGRLDEAAKELLVAIQLKPDLAEAHNNLGVAYMDQNRYEDATKEFLWVLKRNPYYRFTHNNMGLVNLRQNKLDAAAMYLRNALKLNPDYTDARYNLALTLEKQGKIDEAIKEYRSVLIHTPTLLNKINNFGTCRLGAGKLDEAITKFQVVLTLDPNFVQAHYNLGLAYSKQGHYQQAIQEFRTAIRLKPDLAIAHYKLALMYEKQNKSGEAVLELEHAVKLKPDYSEALSKLELLRNPAKKQQINK